MAKFSELTPDYHEQNVQRLAATIPAFLVRNGPRLTNEQARNLAYPQIAWAPFRDHTQTAPKMPTRVFITDENLPVEVVVKLKEGNKVLNRYANMRAFRFAHKLADYPVGRVIETDTCTFIQVTAKPWAKDHDTVVTATGETMQRLAAKISGVFIKEEPKPEKGPRKMRRDSKVYVIGDLLLRSEGCTAQDVMKLTGWPSVSMPAQAKLAGLTLRKEKTKGQPTRYWGNRK